MNATNRYLSRAALVIAAAASLTACGDGGGGGITEPPPGGGPPGSAGDVIVTGNITSSRTFTADTTYVLRGAVKVQSGATLTIMPGTTVKGDTATGFEGSSLWILRGARIMAEGTRDQPIVLTSGRPAGSRSPGDWGGLIIIGNGLINRTANPIFTEGPADIAENYAGGTDFNDSSGSLKYVRVEFAGFDITQSGDELNSISSYAVGRGTTYDYVQSLGGLDDSFEFFGGAADIRHMVSYESGDDHFDWTEGFRGRGQFLIALQTTVLQPRPNSGGVSSDPRGFEGDGCETKKAGCAETNQPFSNPLFANFTLIGPGPNVFASLDGNGAVIRRGSGAMLVNGIIGRWPGVAISLRDATTAALLDADSVVVRNLLLADNGGSFDPAGQQLGPVLDQPSNNIRTVSGVQGLLSSLPAAGAVPTVASLNWVPAAGSAAATGGLTSFAGTPIAGRVDGYFGGTLQATGYVGAADPSGGDRWWEGWTSYARN